MRLQVSVTQAGRFCISNTSLYLCVLDACHVLVVMGMRLSLKVLGIPRAYSFWMLIRSMTGCLMHAGPPMSIWRKGMRGAK